MEPITAFGCGLGLGLLIMTVVLAVNRRNAQAVAEKLFARTEQLRAKDLERALETMKASFSILSQDALSRTGQQFVQLAGETLTAQVRLGGEHLEGKKVLIDNGLEQIGRELKRMEETVRLLEKDREQKFGQLSRHLEQTAEQTGRLQETADQLRRALASTKLRGQWGERMAEDVLRMAGFIEGVNYLRQKTIAESGTRPDFTFLLPQGLKIHMDVKFPLENYMRFLDSGETPDRERHLLQFLRDVRMRVREVTGREYIDPGDQTVDFVLLFIPNEQIYGFIHEHDRQLLDEALRLRVVLCSPLTLYAVLAVIRQAADNFRLEQTASQILELLAAFKKQWDLFAGSMDRLGVRLKAAHDEYDALVSTRRRQLERSLAQIDGLRRSQGLLGEAAASEEDDADTKAHL